MNSVAERPSISPWYVFSIVMTPTCIAVMITGVGTTSVGAEATTPGKSPLRA